MTACRTGIVAGSLLALGFWAVASVLGFQPYTPLASRYDVFLQTDAGALVMDAVIDYKDRARGVHMAIYPLWTWPLHKLCNALSPTIAPEVTATYVSRFLVNASAGLGWGYLCAVLRRRGIATNAIMIMTLLMATSPGNAIAAMPDHFGISLGILAASFGVFLSPLAPYRRLGLLILFTALAGLVTITNVLFPLLLIVVRGYRELPRWLWFSGLGLIVAGGLAVIALYATNEGLKARIDERVRLYLTWRVIRDPSTAAKMATRGFIDSCSGATPEFAINNSEEQFTMLTFQPPGVRYPLWPYDALQSLGAIAWLVIFAVGLWQAWRRERAGTIVLLVWCFWNSIFHNIWGDEYFLYLSHFAWAVLVIPLLGWRSTKGLLALSIPILIANLSTLWIYRTLLATIPA